MPEPKPLNIAELEPPLRVTLVHDGRTLNLLREWANKMMAQKPCIVGLDTETNITPDFWDRRVRTIQIGTKEEQFVIDLLFFAGSEERLIESQGFYGARCLDVYKEIFSILDPILCDNKALKVGVNLSFEYEVFNWNFGRRIWNLYSTDLSERVIRAGDISLKNYAAFSMAGIMQRYFNVIVDKEEQGTFDLKTPLTEKQITYAALDVRLPIVMRQVQLYTLMQDKLKTTSQIENDAIGAFVDMHLAGQNMDDARWMKRIDSVKQQRVEDLQVIDETFLPIVGRKDQAIDHGKIAQLEKIWREDFEKATPREISMALKLKEEKDKNKKNEIRIDLDILKKKRAEAKQEARAAYSQESKKRTELNHLIEKCEGEALINLNSPEQLLAALQRVKGLARLGGVAEDDLLKYNDLPFIQVLRRFRKGKKDTGTYGIQWTQRWINKPCKAEGWRHPGDGRLHCTYNQLEAETGRTSSSKPNAQNLPHDPEVRACFICDPPNENIRISCCCDADTDKIGLAGSMSGIFYTCKACGKVCETKAEEYCIVTVDMSGAELRIIAELANAKSWIQAFAKGQDVHSVSTEILYPDLWPKLQIKSKHKEKWTLEDSNEKTGEKIPLFDKDGKPVLDKKGNQKCVPPCAYYAVLPNGEYAKHKCSCPEHKKLRDETKATNFLLCYGGGPDALADAIGSSVDYAKGIMEKHRAAFPDVWGYLEESGNQAMRTREARDKFGRRRQFPEPTLARAEEYYIEKNEDKLEYPEEIKLRNVFEFKAKNGRDPKKEELWHLEHRKPTAREIEKGIYALRNSVGRRGKNHCIQGTNASIIKRAMGCGFDKDGKPYLWHLLPQYKAKVLNMVHDELVVQCPKRFGQLVLNMVGDAFKRAAAEVMTKVVMEHEGHISNMWEK